MSLITAILLLISSAIVVTQVSADEDNTYGISVEADKYCPFNGYDPLLYNTLNYTRVVVEKAYEQTVNKKPFLIIKLLGNCYSNISEISRKGVPIVVTDWDENNPNWRKYPKCGEWKPKEWGLEEFNEYVFPSDPDYLGSYWKNGELQGFNTDWLGCPPDWCLNTIVDADDFNGIIRGRYVKKRNSRKVYPVSVSFENKLIDGYFDASFYAFNIHYIIKKDRFWFADKNLPQLFKPNNTSGLSVKKYFGEEFPRNIDSILLTFQYKMFFFRDDQYMTAQVCGNCPRIDNRFPKIVDYSNWTSVTTLHSKFPKNVYRILEMNDYFYLFSGWKYYILNKDRDIFEDTVKEAKDYAFGFWWVFTDRYRCTDKSYSHRGYKSFNNFLHLFNRHMFVSTTPKPTIVSTIKTTIRTTETTPKPTIVSTFKTTIRITETTPKMENSNNWNNILYIVVILVVIVIVLVMSYYIFCRTSDPLIDEYNRLERQTLEEKSSEEDPNVEFTQEEQRHLPLNDPRRTFDKQPNPSTQPSVVVPKPTQSAGKSIANQMSDQKKNSPKIRANRRSPVPQISGALQSDQI